MSLFSWNGSSSNASRRSVCVPSVPLAAPYAASAWHLVAVQAFHSVVDYTPPASDSTLLALEGTLCGVAPVFDDILFPPAGALPVLDDTLLPPASPLLPFDRVCPDVELSVLIQWPAAP